MIRTLFFPVVLVLFYGCVLEGDGNDGGKKTEVVVEKVEGIRTFPQDGKYFVDQVLLHKPGEYSFFVLNADGSITPTKSFEFYTTGSDFVKIMRDANSSDPEWIRVSGLEKWGMPDTLEIHFWPKIRSGLEGAGYEYKSGNATYQETTKVIK
ncbi:MAG: hypothetical protein Q7S84_04680 [bacterium]|nr:hypothetical protein [bacterium]